MAIFSAIGAAIAGALFAGSTLAATIIGSGLAFAAQLGFQYLNRPKKRKYTAIQGETQYGGDVAVGTLLGTGKTKGQRAFYAKWGKGNKENGEVFLLANGWCDGLEPYVYFYGQKHTLTPTVFPGNHVAAYEVENFGGNILMLFFDGRPGQQVESRLVGLTAGLGQTWKETSVNAGQAYVVVYRTYDAKYFSQGKPEFEFVLRGLREYDPRKDSTVVGGSGPQRINDPATWAHTLNPAVHRLNYQLGLRALVSGRTLIGEGKSLGQLDLGSYFVAMNVCDSLRTDGKRTYQCSLFVTGEDDHTEILKEFDDAMAGYGLNRRGLSGVIAGAPQIPVLEITADDLPIDRAKEVQFRKSAFDRYNHLSGQFLSIEANWNPESLTPVYVNADVTADGRNRQTSNDFLQVTDPDIAQYLLNIRYRQNRRGGTATVPVSRRVGLKVQEGEWVVWRGKEWMISEWVLDEQFRVTLKLSETGADIYDDEGIEPGPVVIPPAPVINPSMLSTVQNFNVAAGMITGAGGHDVPCLQFTWTPPVDPTIVAVRIFFRQSGQIAELLVTCTDPESGTFTTTEGIVSGTIYDARATITTVPDRLKTFTPWKTTAVATGEVYLPGMVEGIKQFVGDATEFVRDGARQLMLDQLRLATLSASQNLSDYTDRQKIRREVLATANGLTARYTEEIEAATGPNSALARRTQTLEAVIPLLATATAFNALVTRVSSVEGITTSQALAITNIQAVLPNKADASALSSLATTVTEINGKTTSLADAITALSAGTVGGNTATANFRMGVSAGPAGYSSRIAMEVRSGGVGGWQSAGLFIDVGPSGSRIVLQANQIAFTNGAVVKSPFVYEADTLFLDQAVIRQARIIDLLVGTSNIAPGAVSVFNLATAPTTINFDGLQTLTVDVAHGTGSPIVVIFATGFFAKRFTDDTGVNIAIGPVSTGGGGYFPVPAGAAFVNALLGFSFVSTHQPASGTASTTYTLNLNGRGTTSNRQIFALVMRR